MLKFVADLTDSQAQLLIRKPFAPLWKRANEWSRIKSLPSRATSAEVIFWVVMQVFSWVPEPRTHLGCSPASPFVAVTESIQHFSPQEALLWQPRRGNSPALAVTRGLNVAWWSINNYRGQVAPRMYFRRILPWSFNLWSYFLCKSAIVLFLSLSLASVYDMLDRR